MSHLHAPVGAADTYAAAKIGRCSCGVDLVSYLAPEGARYNWEEWRPTSLGDPCLSCGDYDTPSCCEAEAVDPREALFNSYLMEADA